LSPAHHQQLSHNNSRLNKFVKRLHVMLLGEAGSGIVEWRRGLLILHSTDAFAKTILPKYFNTRNFKTFRRQLNYYGFVHVRSFSITGASTTALWVNQGLAQTGTDHIDSVLSLRRVEPCDVSKTAEGRRVRKEEAIHTVEEDIGVNTKSLQLGQVQGLAAAAARQVSAELTSSVTEEPTFGSVAVTSLEDLDGRSSPILGAGSYAIDDEENTSAAHLLLLLSKACA
jgi:hypothetical protein